MDKGEKHDWFPYHKWIACKKCGFIQNDKNKDKPCRGKVKVTLRNETDSPHTS